MQMELGKVVEYAFSTLLIVHSIDCTRSLVTPMFKDVHPRVRYAACQCVYVCYFFHLMCALNGDAAVNCVPT
jgi:hypothetical protein